MFCFFVVSVILLFSPAGERDLRMTLTVAWLVGQLAALFTTLITWVLRQGGIQAVVNRD